MGLDTIHILAMGPTWFKCPDMAEEGSEIWGCNTIYRNHAVDRLFVMHDLIKDILIQDKNYIDNINKLGVPVYTPRLHEVLENNVIYPSGQVFKEFNIIFFLNVITYMMAYAIMQKPREICLWGVDMRPDSGIEHHQNEKGCVEFWCGVAVGRGIKLTIPSESFILKRTMTSNFYGFVARKDNDGLITLVPEHQRKIYRQYEMTPIDKDGNKIDVSTKLTVDFPMGKRETPSVIPQQPTEVENIEIESKEKKEGE